MKYEVLSPGEKVRKLRKLLGASQKDITANLKTRNTISLIENGKQNLIRGTAAIIAQELNNIAARKNIKIEPVTTDYLLEKKDNEINRIARQFIDELETYKYIGDINQVKTIQIDIQNFMNTYSDFIEYTNKYKIYTIMSDILCDLNLHDESELYVFKAYDVASEKNDIERTIDALNKRITISIAKGEDRNTLNLAKHAIELIKAYSITDSSILMRTFYNAAIAYRKAGQYINCLEYIRILLALTDLQISVLVNVKILKANCYIGLMQYDLAEELYLEAVKDAKENGLASAVARIYRNLSNLCLSTKEYEKAKNYTEIYLNIKKLSAGENALSLYYAVHIYIECDELLLVRRYFFRALKALEALNDSKKQTVLLINATEYFSLKKDLEYLEEIFKYIYEKMDSNILKDKSLIEKAFLISLNFETLGLKDKYNYYRDKAIYLNNKFFRKVDF